MVETETSHLRFCPGEIWKVDFNTKILEFVIDIGFILTYFQSRFDSTLKIQVKLFCESNPKFAEFNLYKTHSSQTMTQTLFTTIFSYSQRVDSQLLHRRNDHQLSVRCRWRWSISLNLRFWFSKSKFFMNQKSILVTF